MRAFLYWLTGHLPCRIIAETGVPYLERYYLLTVFGWRVYIHHFVGSDPDRGLHDHPWARAFSIILAGWYWEQTRAGVRRIRWINSLTGDSFHRVVLPKAWERDPSLTPQAGGYREVSCWTLFMHRSGDVKRWGFLRELSDGDGLAVYEPYLYRREGGKPTEWWLTAKTGRAVRAGGNDA